MSIHYKQSIELLARGGFDQESIIIDYAQRHPADFVRAAKSGGGKLDFKNECRILVEAGKKIDAIKLWRTFTSDSLKDSKDAVERL